MRSCLLGIPLALGAAWSCSLLPDRAYVEASQLPTSTHFGPRDELALTIGFEIDLQPAEVIVTGQKVEHPFDFRTALGIYREDDAEGPTPLVVKDEEMRLLLADLRTALDASTAATDRMALDLKMSADQMGADLKAMREVIVALKGEWDSVNKTLLGGGGLGTLLLIIFGVRHLRNGKPKPQGGNG